MAVAVLASASVAAIGALILGEYDMAGFTPYIAGALFGLVVAEVTLSIARVGTPLLAGTSAVLSGLGMLWAAWISSGDGVAPIPTGAYLGMLLSLIVAAGWVSVPMRGRRAG